MRYVDEFREPRVCMELVRRIKAKATRRWTIMEVCGGQTHGLLRYGIDDELRDIVEFIHGPGCPVCVTPAEAIDSAIAWCQRPGIVIASFGDMIRVPGSKDSLLDVRARGGQVRIVYSPLDAISLARAEPDKQIIFLGVGFETTATTTALAIQQAFALDLDNFSMLSAHVRVLPAMEQLAEAPDNRVHAFLAAGHVCTVDGCAVYESFVDKIHLPVVVAGFEPVDLLVAILHCVEQLEQGEARVENCYQRSVRWAGNPHARQTIDEVYIPTNARWRGIGVIRNGGLAIREKYARFDAAGRFEPAANPGSEDAACRAGDVLIGRLKPIDCPHFGRRCSPETPLGAPMVSAEGACAAYFRYVAVTPQI